MNKYLPIIILISAACLTACSSTGSSSGSRPSLGGNTRYTGTMPPPSDYQSQSAINASTMRAPVRE